MALGLAACAWLATARAWECGATPRCALAPVALAALVLAQAAAGMVPYEGQAVAAALYLVWAALLMVLVAALRRTFGRECVTETLAWALFAGAVAGAVAGLLQHFAIATPLDAVVAMKSTAAVVGNLGQPNHYASHLTLGVISALYLWVVGRMPAAVAAPAAVLMLVMLGLSGSRSVWGYLGVALALAGVSRWRNPGLQGRRLMAAAIAAVAVFAATQWFATLPFMAGQGGVLTVTQKLFAGATGIDERLELWREALAMFVQAPLAGIGWGQFAWHHYLAQPLDGPGAAPGPFHHAHNIVLQLLAETGLLGAGCVVAGALLWLSGFARRMPDAGWWWSLAVLGVLATHSLLEFPLWYAYFLAVAAAVLGLGEPVEPPLRARAGRLVAGAALVVGALNLITVLAAYRGLERHFLQSSGGLTAQEMSDVLTRARSEPVVAPYADMLSAYVMAPGPPGIQEKRALVERAGRFMPADVVAYRLALYAALDGDSAAARRHFERAMRVYPAELPAAVRELQVLAVRFPGEMAPLLELASSELQHRAAPPSVR